MPLGPDAEKLAVLWFVCLGGICRSPILATVAGEHLRRAGESAIATRLAGAAPWARVRRPHRDAVAAARRAGYAIAGRSSSHLDIPDVRAHALIVADRRVAAVVRQSVSRPEAVVDLSDFEAISPSLRGGVPDPHGRGPAAFDHVVEIAELLMPGLMERLSVGSSTSHAGRPDR